MKKNIIAISKFVLILLGIMGIIMAGEKTLSRSSENKISENTMQLVKDIKNDDVKWAGNFVGIMPMKLGGATLSLKDVQEDVNPLIVAALVDQKKFVAAHVLLTLRTSKSYEISADTWNGLKVQLFSSGEVSFDGNDLMNYRDTGRKN